MKTVLVLAIVLVGNAVFASNAETYSWHQKMSLSACLQQISDYAKRNGAKLEMYNPSQFYLMNKATNSAGCAYDNRYGNAYYSVDTCYITND